MFAASKTGRAVAAGAATDPYFNQTVLLLNDTGTNGAQNNTFIDSSTNNFTITRNGNTRQGSVNPYEPTGYWSGNFNGSTQYLTTSGANLAAGTGDFTWECWVYVAGASGYQTFIDSRNGTTNAGLYFGLNTGTLTPIIFNQTTLIFTSSINIVANAWNHVALVRNSGTIVVYINGASGGSLANSYTLSSTTCGIGSYFTSGNPLSGYLSNIRVVNGTAVYTTSFTPPTTPLTAVSGTSLLCLQNNRFIDNSSNNFTITSVASPTITSFNPLPPTASYSGATYGGTMYLDGTGDYLSIPDNDAWFYGTGDFTIETWIYPLSDGRFYSQFANGLSQIWFRRYLGALNFQVNSSSVLIALTTSATLQLNVWTHVAVVRNGNVFTIYMNGVSSATSTVSITLPNLAANLLISSYDGTNENITGYLSNYRIVKGTAVYTSTFTPPTAPVTAITNTQLLLNATNAGIYDATALNDMETVGNAQVSTTQYKWGASSMSFDGTGDWLLFPNNVNITLNQAVFTIEGWIYLNAVGSARGIVGKGTGTTGWLLSINSSNQVVFTDTTTAITSTGTLSVSTWYHIAVVRSTTGTNQTKIYINGTNDGTGTSATNFSQTNSLYVGADRTGGSAFNGYIEDLRITKGVARYTANFTAPTAAFPTR
jgi:hypothetical protein